jgi:hypothetical protein
MNPQKLFNYFLQSLETINNARMIKDMIKVLRNKNTKLVLYVYDSFLFDLDDNEEEIVEELLDIFNKNKFKVKIKKGTNYDALI